MKISTRQYAKKQVNWIKKKLVPAAQKLEDLDQVTIILLDATGKRVFYSDDRDSHCKYTDLSNWNENVRDPAVSILKCELLFCRSRGANTLASFSGERVST